jgi:hypothetical protein
MKISAVSAVTKSCLKDFLLMKKTLEQHHFVQFYLAVDDFCYDYLHENFKDVKCFQLIETEDADHVSQSLKQQSDFINIIKAKFYVAKEAFKDSNFIFWCDVDHIFFNSIEPHILELIDKSLVDAAVSPHHSDGFADEKTVGYYNCGFVLISNPAFLETWEDLFLRHKQLGLYYEQKPLELTTQFYHTITLPINYNVGWWKFLGPNAQTRWDSISLKNEDLKMLNNPLINFHFHYFRENTHAFDQQAFKASVKDIFSRRKKKGDDLIFYEIERLEGNH